MDKEAKLFRSLGDPTRLRLAIILASEGETCVCSLAEALGEPGFKISRHLSVMRAAGIVRARREGTWMHYRLADPETCLEEHLHGCFRACLALGETVRADRRAVRKSRRHCEKNQGNQPGAKKEPGTGQHCYQPGKSSTGTPGTRQEQKRTDP